MKVTTMRRAICLALFATLLVPLGAYAQKKPGAVQPNWAPPTAAGVGWESGTYKYDGSGNVAAIGEDLFGYDGANRLTASTVAAHGVATTQTYRYDRYGNLLEATTSLLPKGVQLPTSRMNQVLTVEPGTNRLSQTCESIDDLSPFCQQWWYDEATGNQTGVGTSVRYQWDAIGSMTELTAGPVHEQYVYDASDERVVVVTLGRTASGGEQELTRRWTWRDAENKVAREAVEHVGTAVWSEGRDYVYRNGMLLASFESPDAAVAERHYHVDHLGTPRLITNAQRGALAIEGYLPFGGRAPGRETARIDFSERMQFTGHERDGDGSLYRPTLDYMHARYYTPQWGRFLSVDPYLDVKKALVEPQRWNRYSYVTNNPLRYTDPDGKERQMPFCVQHPARCSADELSGRAPAGNQVWWTAAIIGGVLVGPALAAEGTLELGLLMMRNPGTVWAAMKLLDAMGGNSSSHINPTGQTGNKLGYLLGKFESSGGKGGLFAGVLGFGEKGLDAAVRSHFAENFAKGELQTNGRLAVTGAMTGANGVVRMITTIWQWNQKAGAWDLITGFQAK